MKGDSLLFQKHLLLNWAACLWWSYVGMIVELVRSAMYALVGPIKGVAGSALAAIVACYRRSFLVVEITALLLLFLFCRSPSTSEHRGRQGHNDTATQAAENEDEMPILTTRNTLEMTEDEVRQDLSYFQRMALEYVYFHARAQHDATMAKLQDRVVDLGYKKRDLDRCLEYIRDDAPIVIHLTESSLTRLANDTHYRNFFEITPTESEEIKRRKASRSSRKVKESSLFSGFYDYCEPFDRPKYGCLNITGDLAGVKSARVFGSMYITLHQHIRHRATFFHTNSRKVDNHKTLGTASYYAHVLDGFDDNDLEAALRVHKFRTRGARCNSAVYKEVQIHVPICLATDIQALSLPGKLSEASDTLLQTVAKFQSISNCNVLWQGDLFADD